MCLRSSISALEFLTAMNCNIDDEGFVAIFLALAGNSSLKGLNTLKNRSEIRDTRTWMTLCRALCDETNISCTYYSNHTLQALSVHRTFSVFISSLVAMNVNENKFEVARQKILETHFSGGSGFLHVFASMPETVMPFAIAWIGRNTLICYSIKLQKLKFH